MASLRVPLRVQLLRAVLIASTAAVGVGFPLLPKVINMVLLGLELIARSAQEATNNCQRSPRQARTQMNVGLA